MDHHRRQRRHNRDRVEASDETRSTPLLERLPSDADSEVDLLWDEEWDANLTSVALDHVKRRVKPGMFQLFDWHVIRGRPVSEVCRRLQVTATQVYFAKYRVSARLRKEFQRLKRQWERNSSGTRGGSGSNSTSAGPRGSCQASAGSARATWSCAGGSGSSFGPPCEHTKRSEIHRHEGETPPLPHAGCVYWACVTPGNRLITASAPNLIRAWDLRPTHLPAEVIADYAKLLSGRQLSPGGVLLGLKAEELTALSRSLRVRAPELFTEPHHAIPLVKHHPTAQARTQLLAEEQNPRGQYRHRRFGNLRSADASNRPIVLPGLAYLHAEAPS